MFADFTSEELALVVARFERTPAWKSWARGRSKVGRDVIEIVPGDAADPVLKVAKMEPGLFAATGVDGWSLTMSEDLEELLDLMARAGTRRRRPAAGAGAGVWGGETAVA